MGVSFSCCAVLGVRVTSDQLTEERTIPGCGHANQPQANFCPVCGKKAWKTERTERFPQFDRHDALVRAFNGTWDEESSSPMATVVGIGVNCDARDGCGFRPLPAESLNVIRTSVYNALHPLGLWDEAKFGLYAVPDISY